MNIHKIQLNIIKNGEVGQVINGGSKEDNNGAAVAPIGISIQHVNGGFYTPDDWVAKGFSVDKSNGVALKTEDCGFVIANKNILYKKWSSNTNNLIDGILTSTIGSEAQMDFAGRSNTELMLKTDTSGAAFACNSYKFPNGANGYLPALGELMTIIQNRTALDNVFKLIGSNNVIPGNPLWSSTQYSATEAWCIFNKNTEHLEKSSEYSCTIVVISPLSI